MTMLISWFRIHRTGLSILEIKQNLKDMSDISSGDTQTYSDNVNIIFFCNDGVLYRKSEGGGRTPLPTSESVFLDEG